MSESRTGQFAKPPPPLNRKQIAEVLRYWLALFRYQEALSARPRARPNPSNSKEPGSAPPVANLTEPVAGQQYAKLPLADSQAFFVAKEGSFSADFDSELCGFFEDWLHATRRRSEDDESPRAGHLVCFPAILLPRSELAGLLRFSVQAQWLFDNGGTFKPPKRGVKTSEAPVRIRLQAEQRDTEESLPFFVDAKLLRETLRIETERLDTFFAELRKTKHLRPAAMVNALSVLVESQTAAELASGDAAPPTPQTPAPEPASPVASGHDAIFERLRTAVTERLQHLRSRARCFPVGLLIHSERSRATYHAQRDIQELIEQLSTRTWSDRSAVLGYLRGQAVQKASSAKPDASPSDRRLRARFTPEGLTAGQIAVAEATRCQTLCAVQGPPGTGKTTLIVNLVADTLVRKLTPLLSDFALGQEVLLVTSTNNAAVDNVTDALGSGGQWEAGRSHDEHAERLPLSLRVGSRDITERVTMTDLQTVSSWIKRQPPHSEDQYKRVLDAFKTSLEAVDAQLSPATGETDPDALKTLGYELFERARDLREAWVRKNRSNLLNVVQRAITATNSSKSLRRLLDAPGGSGPWLRRLFPAWGSTLLSLGNVLPPAPDCLDQVVIDEAGQCHPGYAISALMRARKALVIGDVHQLEPVIGLSREDEQRIVNGLGLKLPAALLEPYRAHDDSATSAQALADRAVPERPTLTDHFRCQPAIANICERLCHYGLVAHTPPHSLVGQASALSHPVLMHPVDGEQERAAGSWMNAAELHVVVRWVLYLLGRNLSPDDIGIITPFRGQLEALHRALREARVPLAALASPEASTNLSLFGAPDKGLAVGTVHRFQGGERNVIIFSTTVTRRESLRFVDERANLVNVAASRARHHLLTVGHHATLKYGQHTAALLTDAHVVTAT